MATFEHVTPSEDNPGSFMACRLWKISSVSDPRNMDGPVVTDDRPNFPVISSSEENRLLGILQVARCEETDGFSRVCARTNLIIERMSLLLIRPRASDEYISDNKFVGLEI